MLEKIDYKKFILPIVVGLVLWFLAPVFPHSVVIATAGVKTTVNLLPGWHMFAIFVATIIGLITKPVPLGAMALIGFACMVLFGVVPIATIPAVVADPANHIKAAPAVTGAITAFGNSTIWLIGMAFFMSRGIIKSGLGRRIALIFIRTFGKRTLGLAYALEGVDLVLSPGTPSNTARAGGIMYPIINSLSDVFKSSPKDGTERKIGSFLIYSEWQSNIITSAFFLTAMAPNLVAQTLAAKAGVAINWGNWFLAALVPAVISLICVPWIIYKLFPPEQKETPDAKEWADKELAAIGKVTLSEIIMIIVFVAAIVLWITGTKTGIDATTTGFVAVGLLLLTGVLSWDDILKETGAWNTIFWFGVLVFMATELQTMGIIPWVSNTISGALSGMNWFLVLVVLVLVYFYVHYIFASGTAQVTALYGAFLAIALALKVPPILAATTLAFFGALNNSTTHYASGPAAVLFGAGYVKQNDWWRLNFILGIFYLIVWVGIGALWTKLIGFW